MHKLQKSQSGGDVAESETKFADSKAQCLVFETFLMSDEHSDNDKNSNLSQNRALPWVPFTCTHSRVRHWGLTVALFQREETHW